MSNPVLTAHGTFGSLVSVHLPVDLDEDACVAEAHDQQREDVEGHKVEHVVGRLLPAVLEASVGHALDKVHPLCLHRPEDEQLAKYVTQSY